MLEGMIVRRFGVSIRQWRCQGPSRGRSLVSPGGRARRYDGDDDSRRDVREGRRRSSGRGRSRTLAGRRADRFRACRHRRAAVGGCQGRREGRRRRPRCERPSRARPRRDLTGDPSLSRSFGPSEHDVVSVVFSPDGKRIATRSPRGDISCGSIPSAAISGAELGARNFCKDLVVSWSISPDGKRRGLRQLRITWPLLWDAETGELVRSFKGHSDDVVLRRLFTRRQEARFWKSTTRRQSGFGTLTAGELCCEASIRRVGKAHSVVLFSGWKAHCLGVQ